MKKSQFALILSFVILLGSAFYSKVSTAQSPIVYIRADGSIDPSTSPISTTDNVTYTLTGNITASGDGIVVERDNIMVDGAGYTVQGTGIGNGTGMTLSGRSNITIKNTEITTFHFIGIWLDSSSNTTISGNNITNNNVGIWLNSSSNNVISGNNITANYGFGISLDSSSSNNSISENNITNNEMGIVCTSSSNYNTVSGNTLANNGVGIHGFGIYLISSNDTIYHNNFINNTNQFYSSGLPNVWDNGFEGNYWSDYNGKDNNQDGIGDTPYIIDENNTDHYPLMGHFKSFNVSTWNHPNDGFEEVDVISNFTISDIGLREWLTTPNQYLQAGQLFLSLSPVQGQGTTPGFCRITVPNNMLNTSDYTVLINMTPISVNKLAISNNTQTTLYFTFNASPDEIIIVPEFPSFLILPLFFITTLLAVIIYRKKHA